MAEGYPFSLAYKKNSLARPVIPIHVTTSILWRSCTVKMSNIQVTIPLQMVCRLIIASQVGENMTLPLNWNQTLVENETLPVNQETDVVEATSLPGLPSGYVAFPEFGVAYKLFETEVTHDEARKACLQEDGQLAVIDSREKVQKVLDHFTNGNFIWVGLVHFPDASEWTTIDGKSTNNLPWASCEPIPTLRCGSLWKSQNGLHNLNCYALIQHLCEIALPQN